MRGYCSRHHAAASCFILWGPGGRVDSRLREKRRASESSEHPFKKFLSSSLEYFGKLTWELVRDKKNYMGINMTQTHLKT
jgi:hypothetical protein